MDDQLDEIDFLERIDKFTEEAKEIQGRCRSSQNIERVRLEARCAELEADLASTQRRLQSLNSMSSHESGDPVQRYDTGPFGIYLGMPVLETWPDAREFAPGIYSLNTVPKPHSAFGRYFVSGTSRTGVCSITAVGNDIATNVFGTELQTYFRVVLRALRETYGQDWEVIDSLRNGSLWSAEREWMTALSRNERVLSAERCTINGAMLSHGLRSIKLSAKADNEDKSIGRIWIDYYFANYASFDEEMGGLGDKDVL